MQYANRAKNIQNKAVKNIDSRSAELLNLKAFNELLRRELVKARFMHAAGVDPSQIEAMVDMMLKDPAVLVYLRRLEQIAASSGVEAYGNDAGADTEKNQALLSRLSAHLSSMLSDRGNDGSLQSEFARQDPFGDGDLDAMSDGGSSVAMMEDKVCEEREKLSPFSLEQLCRTLEVISMSLEIQSIGSLAVHKRSSIESKILRQEMRIHRKETVAAALEEALVKMSSWTSSTSSNGLPVDGEHGSDVVKHIGTTQNKLEQIKCEIARLGEEKRMYAQELHEHNSRIRKQINAKQESIDQVRATRDQLKSEAMTNPLDILIRSSEIKVRILQLCWSKELN